LRGITAYAMGVARAGATVEAARRRMATTDTYIVTGIKCIGLWQEQREKDWLVDKCST
jgi:hypothetical protein